MSTAPIDSLRGLLLAPVVGCGSCAVRTERPRRTIVFQHEWGISVMVLCAACAKQVDEENPQCWSNGKWTCPWEFIDFWYFPHEAAGGVDLNADDPFDLFEGSPFDPTF